MNSYSSWEALTADDYYLDSGSGGGGGGGAGQSGSGGGTRVQIPESLTGTSMGAGMYTTAGSLTLASSPLPSNDFAVQSATQRALSQPSIIPAGAGVDLARMLSVLGSNSAGWQNLPSAPISGGGVVTSLHSPLLASNMAGWPGTSSGKIEQLVQHLYEAVN